MNTIAFLDTLARDIRCGLRMLRHNPMFTAVALLTLAIGIGANTTVFSLVNSVLLKPLNYPKPDELVDLRQLAPVPLAWRASPMACFSPPRCFSPMPSTIVLFSRWASGTPIQQNVTGLAEPEQVRIIEVTDGLLQTLDVQPAAGRWLSQADQLPDGPKTAMLSYSFWHRRFGGQRSVIGRIIRVDSLPRQIVGVMPKNFRIVDTPFDLIIPLAF